MIVIVFQSGNPENDARDAESHGAQAVKTGHFGICHRLSVMPR